MSLFKSDPPPPPNYAPIADALKEQSAQANQLAQEQFTWAKQAYADNLARNQPVEDALTAQMAQQTDFASKLEAQYENNIVPLQNELISTGREYATPGSAIQEQRAGTAGADVAQQFEGARNANLQTLEGYGINPNATRFAALDLGARTQEAAAVAGAQNTSRMQSTAMGLGIEQGAANLGATLPGAAAGTGSAAVTSGTSAANTGLATTASGANTMGTAGQYYGLGNNALGLWGNTLNTGYQNASKYWDMQNAGATGFGQALGTALGMGSKFAMSKYGSSGGMFSEGGAIPDPKSAPAKPWADDDFVALSRMHPDGHLMEPHETIRHFHITNGSNHIGNFKSPHEAHRHVTRHLHGVGTSMPHSPTGDGSDTPQRQNYEKMFEGGRAGGYEKFADGGMSFGAGVGYGAGSGNTGIPSPMITPQNTTSPLPAAAMANPQPTQAIPPPMASTAQTGAVAPMQQPTTVVPPTAGVSAPPMQPTTVQSRADTPQGNTPTGSAIPSWGTPYMLGGREQYFAGGGETLPPGYSGYVPPQASPSMGRTTDDVPAALNAGEFVIPKDVAAWKGEEFFQKMITQSRQAKTGAPAKPTMGPAIPGRR